FGLALPPRSPASLKNALKNFLYDAAVLDGFTLVVFVDEAQNASDEIFEVVRLLLNYDIPDRKLLNVVLFGQSELRRRVDARRNLADRVDGWTVLEALDTSESRALIAYRIARAGGPREATGLFEDDALTAITAAASGTPRRLLNLAHDALREAAAHGRPRVGLIDAQAAARVRGLFVAPAVGETIETAPVEKDVSKQGRFSWLAPFRAR
ncbi:MAG TPA: AAA family ATPase, partial [Candidatus Acidoferrum sp.]|nr:AAA family ATPase [Candidatus Acidoferrum sp.]